MLCTFTILITAHLQSTISNIRHHIESKRHHAPSNQSVISLGISVGSLYVGKHFHKDSKANALEMVNEIRNVFNDILDEVNWMDAKTKKEAKLKLHSMATHIGYPDEMLDNEKLAAYYAKLDIDPDKYFESFLGMNIFGTDYSFNKLRLPVNKTDWVRHARPAIVNAFYSSLENSIRKSYSKINSVKEF